MAWQIEYLKDAVNDLLNFDKPQRIQVLKAIAKVSENSLPQDEGGLGKPLGNHAIAKLSGYYKIKLRKSGIRVVYGLIRKNKIMRIIVISVRVDDTVYKIADKRISHN